MLFLNPGWGVSLLLWIIMGIAVAGLGMSVMHDANHGAYSSNQVVNWCMAHVLNIMGGSTINWKLQHNILHHTYTNITGMDDDIASKPVLRLSPHSPQRPAHRYQWWHAFLLYSLTTLYWVTAKDFIQWVRYRDNKVNAAPVGAYRWMLVRLIIGKLLYFSIFLIMPTLFFDIPFLHVITGFLAMHFIAGLILTVIFQLAHSLEGTSHPLPNSQGVIENDWAIHQMNTTMNFSPHNKWLSWYVGGLNFQVEHHLFPRISHVHYPAIAPIVQATAAEFKIPYLQHRSFLIALQCAYRIFKKTGKVTRFRRSNRIILHFHFQTLTVKSIYLILLSGYFSLLNLDIHAQCGTYPYTENIYRSYPEMRLRYGNKLFFADPEPYRDRTGLIIVPVAVHVVYNNNSERISEERVHSQIEAINRDFSSTNPDVFNTPEPFRNYLAGDCQIRFRLDTIIWKKTNVQQFVIDLDNPRAYRKDQDPIKFTDHGGSDTYKCNNYLNIWCGNFCKKEGEDGTSRIGGYATYPGGVCAYDGVVIHYSIFGVTGIGNQGMGRTGTHEVGHWLDLHHIWGDAVCGNDGIDDTPMGAQPNYGCPNFPVHCCGNEPDGSMFMNYMDYVDDGCKVMFTQGQKNVMRKTLLQKTKWPDRIKCLIAIL